MLEKGQVDRFKESLKKSRKVCESNLLQGKPLGLFKIGTLFLILGFGISLSLIFSISEKFHYGGGAMENFKIRKIRVLIKPSWR